MQMPDLSFDFRKSHQPRESMEESCHNRELHKDPLSCRCRGFNKLYCEIAMKVKYKDKSLAILKKPTHLQTYSSFGCPP